MGYVYLNKTNKKHIDSIVRYIDYLAPILFGIFLFSGYLIPNTLWQYYSATGIVDGFISTVLVKTGEIPVLMTTVLAAICIILSYYSKGGNDKKLLWAYSCSYISIYIISIIFHLNRSDPLRTSMMLIPFLLGMLAVRCLGINKVIICICLLSTFQALYTIADYLNGYHCITSGIVRRCGGTFNSVEQVDTIYIAILPLLIYLSVIKTGFQRIFWIISLLVMYLAFITTWNRACFIAAFISISWLCYRLNFNRKMFMTVVSFMFIMAIITFGIRSHGVLNHVSASNSINARPAIWSMAYKTFITNWTTGVGIGNASFHVTANRNGISHYYWFEQPFNSWLHWLVEMGLIGGILFALFVWRIFLCIRALKTEIAIAVGASWMGLWITGIAWTTIALTINYGGNLIIGILLGTVLFLSDNISTDKDMLLEKSCI